MKPTLLFAVSGLLLLGALAALGINGSAGSPRATGLMPDLKTETGIYHKGTKTQSRIRPEVPVYAWLSWRLGGSIPILWPEVVSTADRPRLVMDEIIVRAPHANRLADAAAPVSVIN